MPGSKGGLTKIMEKGEYLILSGMRPETIYECQLEEKCPSLLDCDCTMAGSVYKWRCFDCSPTEDERRPVEDSTEINRIFNVNRDMVYIGSSSFSLHKRSVEHLGGI